MGTHQLAQTLEFQRAARRRAKGYLVVGVLAFSSLPNRALAEPPPEPARREQARKLAAQGFDALQRKDYAVAEDLFRRADELVHAPTLVVDHARALVGLGKLVEGHEGFAQVLREGVPANAPWQWKKAVDVAAAELAAVEPRLAWLTINVKGGVDAQLEIDGKPVPAAVRGIRRATNPGLRVISARAERYLPVQTTVTLKEGESASLEMELQPDPNAPPIPVAPTPAPDVIVVAAPLPRAAPDRTLATILLSAGGVGVVTGLVTGFVALRVRSDLRRDCAGTVCLPSNETEYSDYREKRDRYRAFGTASGVAFAVGAVASLGGAALLVFGGGTSTQSTAARESSSPKPVGPMRSTGPKEWSIALGMGSFRVSGRF